MHFSQRLITAALLLATTALAVPAPQGTSAKSECCCCNPSIPATVCTTIASGNHCICPAVFCEPKVPKLKQCCCCDNCSLIPYEDNCYCTMRVCPTTSVN